MIVKTVAAQPTTNKLVAAPHLTTSPLKGISDHLNELPLDACVELTRWLLTSISYLPTGVARPRAVLKTVVLFVAEYGFMGGLPTNASCIKLEQPLDSTFTINCISIHFPPILA